MATTVILFNSFIRAVHTGGASLSKTYRVALATSSWTPNNDTSAVASLSSAWCTSASGGDAYRQCAPPGNGTLADQFTAVSDGVFKFDLSDCVVTATSGQQLDVRYVHYVQSAGAIPMGYYEVSITSVAAAQFTVQHPSAGIFVTGR